MTVLDDYLNEGHISGSELARRLNTHRQTVSQWRRGKAVPSLHMAFEIERVTNGRVKPSDFRMDAPAASERQESV